MLLTAPYHSVFSVGFQNVVSIDMLRESFPLLDMVDHNRRPKLPVRYWSPENDSRNTKHLKSYRARAHVKFPTFHFSPIPLPTFLKLKVSTCASFYISKVFLMSCSDDVLLIYFHTQLWFCSGSQFDGRQTCSWLLTFCWPTVTSVVFT